MACEHACLLRRTSYHHNTIKIRYKKCYGHYVVVVFLIAQAGHENFKITPNRARPWSLHDDI